MSVFFPPRTARSGGPGWSPYPSASAERGTRRTAGVSVSWDSALSLAAVWACVRLRADLVSTLPIDVFRGRGGVAEPVTTPAVLVTPAGNGVSIDQWLYASQVSLDLRGNSYGLIVDRDGRGLPTQIELQHPDTVWPRLNLAGELVYRIAGVEHPARDVWHEKQFVMPGALVGTSPIAQVAAAIGVPLAAEQFGADWFDAGAHPSSLLQNEDERMPDAKLTQAAKERFMAAVQRREPVVLGSGWKWTQIQVSANESQFLETMRWGVQQVCRVFGVPPEMVGASVEGRGITYANVEQRGIHFLVYGLGPTITRRERALSALTPAPQYVKFNVGALLRTDTLTRFQAHEIAIRNKFETIDEVRSLEDLPPLTDEQIAGLATLPVSPGTLAPMPAAIPVTQEGP